jgi:hypothetical protein
MSSTMIDQGADLASVATATMQSMSTRTRSRRVQQAQAFEEAEAAVVSVPNFVLENSINPSTTNVPRRRIAGAGAHKRGGSRRGSERSSESDISSSCDVDNEQDSGRELWLPNCANALAYLDACEKYDIKIDPNIVICLQSRFVRFGGTERPVMAINFIQVEYPAAELPIC